MPAAHLVLEIAAGLVAAAWTIIVAGAPLWVGVLVYAAVGAAVALAWAAALLVLAAGSEGDHVPESGTGVRSRKGPGSRA